MRREMPCSRRGPKRRQVLQEEIRYPFSALFPPVQVKAIMNGKTVKHWPRFAQSDPKRKQNDKYIFLLSSIIMLRFKLDAAPGLLLFVINMLKVKESSWEFESVW